MMTITSGPGYLVTGSGFLKSAPGLQAGLNQPSLCADTVTLSATESPTTFLSGRNHKAGRQTALALALFAAPAALGAATGNPNWGFAGLAVSVALAPFTIPVKSKYDLELGAIIEFGTMAAATAAVTLAGGLGGGLGAVAAIAGSAGAGYLIGSATPK